MKFLQYACFQLVQINIFLKRYVQAVVWMMFLFEMGALKPAIYP